jgi:repressor LexA
MDLKIIVRRGRLALGLSARAMAEVVNVSHSYISQIERGVIKRPSPMVLKRLADELDGVSYWELLRVCGYTGEEEEGRGEEKAAEKAERFESSRRKLMAERLREVAAELVYDKETDGAGVPGFCRVPVFTTIPASFGVGPPAVVLEYDEFETTRIHESKLNGDREAFALRVKGDSMVEAGILEGDLVVVSPNMPYKSGDICVIRISGGEHSIKRVVLQDDLVILQPCNSRYEPIVLDKDSKEDLHVYGRVVHVERSFI